ncbi:hypothetical protein BHF70_09010 [Anaerostipes sp. 494a]|nr:hypothetical protein BHF70_09010 [Anaerostipes sp. 494a]
MLLKISSYNIFNNFFPGIAFCYMVKYLTNYELDTGSVWENLFIYYFWGLIISRIGSVVIENILLKIKIKNKESKLKENYINRAPYEEYSRASEKYSFIKILNETNNVYRTMVSTFACVLIIKIYEVLSVYCVKLFGQIGMVFQILFLAVGIILFIMSYKKQTDYIRKRVQDYMIQEDKK